MSKSRVAIHSFAECRKLWQKLDATSKEQATQLASVAWNTPGHEIANSVPVELLQELESKGVVDKDDEKWRFVPAEMLFFLRAIVLIDSLALHSRQADEVLQELEQLVESARCDSISTVKDCRRVASFILAQLVNEHSREDVLRSAVSDEMQDHQFWFFYDLVSSSLPVLEVDIHILERTVRAAEQRAMGDLAGGRAYQAAEYLGRFRPDFAFEVVDNLVESADEVTAGFLERLLTGIAASSLENLGVVAARCEIWLGSDEQALCQVAICCSQNLILDDKLEPDWLLCHFNSLVAKSDSVRYTLSIAVATLGAHFEERSEECLGMLQRLKAAGPASRATYGIAYALSRVKDEMAIDYKVTCLSLLVDVPARNKGAIQRIGWVLHSIARSQPEAVWKYLRRWISSHDTEESIAQHDMFLSTVQDAYRNAPSVANRVLTNWFSAKELRLVEEARSILAELGTCVFDGEVISSLPAPVIVYVTEKLLVGHFEPIQLMRLFHSVLANTAELEELRGYLSTSLWYLVWNYPSAAQSLFERVVDEEETSVSSTVLIEVRDQFEEYQRQRKGVFTPELSSSKRRVEKYYQLEGKKMQVVQEAMLEDDRFPLQKLIPRVSIARGDRTFHMDVFHPDQAQRRTFTEPRGFGKLSESIELPRGEIIDPEGEALRRVRRRVLTLEELLEDE